jgi:hypothetical protein
MSGPMTDAFGRRRFFNQHRMCTGCRPNTKSEPQRNRESFHLNLGFDSRLRLQTY